MFDLKTKKTFLKKTKYENIKQGEVLAFNNEFLKISSTLFQRIFISAIPLFFTQEHSKLWIMETISQERVVQHGLKVHSFSWNLRESLRLGLFWHKYKRLALN